MEPELKELIDKARSRGASMDEMRSIMQDYYGLKKKVQSDIPPPLMATFPSTSEMDSSESRQSTGLEGGEEPSLSDLLQRPLIGDRRVPQYVADILSGVASDFDNAYTSVLYDRFDVDKYKKILEYEGSANDTHKELLAAFEMAGSEGERLEAKSDIVDYYIQEEDPDYDLSRYILGSVDERVFNNMTGNAAIESSDFVAIPEKLSVPVADALTDIGGVAAKLRGPEYRKMLPEDIQNDPEQISAVERYLFDEYNLALDLNEDTFIGGYEVLKGGAFAGTGTSTAKAWHEAMAGGKFMLGDAVASVFGEDNLFTRWAVKAGSESRDLAKEAEERLPFSLQSYATRTESLFGRAGAVLTGGGSGEGVDESADLGDWVNESLRMGGESLPMMGAAIAAGVITRGRAKNAMGLRGFRGLKGAEKVAAGRKIIEANKNLNAVRATNLIGKKQKQTTGARIAKQAGKSQNRGALAATTAMGMASTYNTVRDEVWFEEMNAFEKAGYTSVMGFLEGAPAFVGAAIATNILRQAGKKAVQSFATGLMKSVFVGATEEALTEGATAAGQYYINTIANPQMKFTQEGLWEATKEGVYAGAFLGAGVAGAANIPAGIKAAAMAATSIPGLRDSIEVKKLAREYDLAGTEALRKEIGAKLNAAVMKAWDRKLGRSKFYERLQESNPEAFNTLEQLQKKIARLGIDYSRTENQPDKKSLREQLTALIDERTKQEAELGLEYDIDSSSEAGRILRGVSKIDKRYNGYGEIFQGEGDSVTVTGENVDAVLDAINDTTLNGVQQIQDIEDSTFKSGAQMKRAMTNVMKVVKALSKTGKFDGVVIHKTDVSFMNATGEETARGMWSGKGKIHIYAPAVLENTGFHEAYHDLVLESLGTEAMTALSEKLFSGLSGELRPKFVNFLKKYGAAGDIRKAIRNSPSVAEEFLVELLGDITVGDVEAKVKRGLINSFKAFINTSLNKIGVDVDLTDADPKQQDLVNAIQKMTGQLAEGQEVTGVADLKEATIRAGYNAMSIEVEDMESKPQGIDARMRDVEEVTDAARFSTAMDAAIKRMRDMGKLMALQVTALSEADAQEILDGGGKLFMTKDELAGAYVNPDGYMGGLFKNPDSQLKAVSAPLQTIRAREGGKFYDAFATKLEDLYIANGWKPVARLDFNPEYAPEGWDNDNSPLKNQPDVVFFVKGEGVKGDGIRMSDYMEAYNYAEGMANGKAQAIVIKSLEDNPGRDSFLSREGVTEEQLEQRRGELKLDETQRQKRSPKVVDALKNYVAQEITQDQYIQIVREESPITPFVSVPSVPTTLDIGAALASNKLEAGIVGVNKEVPEGYYVGLRLDIPAYDNYDVWVVSVHQGAKGEERTPNLGGKSIGYAQTALATNVEFQSIAKGALNIALEKGKTTIARMFGDWNNHDPQGLRDRAEEIMASEEYNKSDLGEDQTTEAAVTEEVALVEDVVNDNSFTHRTPSIEAIETWANSGQVVGRGETINTFNEKVPATLSERVGGEQNRQSPNFQRGKIYGKGTADGKGGFVIISKTDAVTDEDVVPNRGFTNQPSFDKSRGVGVVKPNKRGIENYDVYSVNEDGSLTKRDWSEFKSQPKKKADAKKKKLEGWIQVGMNPFRHSWFYDKRDGQPIVSASEVIQIGALVLAKNAEKVAVSDERFSIINKDGSTVKFQHILPGQSGLPTEQTFSNKAQKFGRFSNKYSKDDAEFKKLMKKSVKHNADLYELLSGRTVVTSSPDNLMVGDVYFDDELIFTGGGGVFYPVRTGNVWAVAKAKEAKEMAEKINAMRKKSPDGKVFFTLISGTQEKLFSNTGALKASEIILRKLVEQGLMPESVFNKILIKSFKQTFPEKKPIRIDGSSSDVSGRILAYMGDVNESTFGKRKYYTDRLFVNMRDALKENEEARLAIQKLLASEAVGKNQGGSIPKGVVSKMLTERFLQGVPPGMIYAAIEIDSDLSFAIEPESSPIFPAALFQVDENGNKKSPILHLFQDKEQAEDSLYAAEDILTTERGFEKQPFIDKFSSKYEGRFRKDGTPKDPLKAAESAWYALLGMRNQAFGMGKVKPKAQAIVDQESKAQGSFLKKVSQLIDQKYPSPRINRDKRRKNPVTGLDETLQLDAFAHTKAEVLKTLVDMGMSKEGAEMMFKKAVAYRQGRTQGKKEGMSVAFKHAAETRKLTTKAKNLKKSLEVLRDKSDTFNEFLAKAIDLIDERMKENSKTPFTRGQVKSIVKYIRQAHKTSGKKVESEGLDAMQSFIDKMSVIFDSRDAKAEMDRYLKGLGFAQSLQARLKKMAKVRGRGSSPKNVTTYAKIANGLASLNPALLPQKELDGFVLTIMETINSMSKTEAVFDKELEEYVGVASPKTPAETLYNKLSNYSAMEELGRQSLFMARAQAKAIKNGTSIEEEYAKLVKNYERSRVSSSRKAILNFIDENPTVVNPDTGETIALNESNPAHIDIVTGILAEQASTKEELKKDAIINDVLIPRIAANIEKLLEDHHIAEILGIHSVEDLDLDALRDRLNLLKRHHVINLDYRLDDYIVNDSVYGIGYMHSLVRGNIDLPSSLSKLTRSKGLKSRPNVFLAPFGTINSFLQNLIPTDRITSAKLRVSFGIAQLVGSFAKADFIHSQLTEMISEEIDRISEEGGSVGTRYDRAIAQLYSMARQLPSFEGERGGAEAAWYIELRDSMRRTIDDYIEQKTYPIEEINEFEDAYSYMFNENETLSEMIARVEGDRSDVTGFVQFVADIHSVLMPQFKNYVERYLGKELEIEENYTAFKVIPETGVKDVDDILSLRLSLQQSLASTSLSHSKKVAGSSFERNPRSLKGKSKIGLDFVAINERTIRENVILSNTIGDVVVANHVINSDAAASLIPDRKSRLDLEKKIMLYVQQDSATVPLAFQPTLAIRGVRFVNPISVLRNAVVVSLFGGFVFQTLKQSQVLWSVAFQANNPMKSIPYLIQIMSEFMMFNIETLTNKDSKLAMDGGRYKLLQNSPVFQRDYEAGNIDPFTGKLNLDEGGFAKLQRKLTSISLKNLKGTDKIAAVASWFMFYGDALISEGVVDSFEEIDWEAEAANPNSTALSYSDMMVSKDQSASTTREAAEIYAQEKGLNNLGMHIAKNILIPFARFSINKKRSVSSDWWRMVGADGMSGLIPKSRQDLKVKSEGAVAMLGHSVETAMFHATNKIVLASLTAYVGALLFGEDDEEAPKKSNTLRDIATQTLIDMSPLPPLSLVDNKAKSFLNSSVWYQLDKAREGDYNLGDDDGYERWVRLNKGVPVFEDGGSWAGPYGDYINDIVTTVHNLQLPNNKVVTATGAEYYVRPEDKNSMMLHFALKTTLAATQIAGLSSSEVRKLISLLDDLPRERRLSSEESLAAYEIIAEKYGRDLISGKGEERLMKLMNQADNPFDKIGVESSFNSSLKPARAEQHMRTVYPEQYKIHMREARKLTKELKNARDYYAYLRGNKENMKPKDFEAFKLFIDTYFSLVKPSFYVQERYIESLEE
jgi:hypothetical protein